MDIFLVGGAVRDQLLDYPFTERDWVVVGCDPETMLAQGFTPVGKDFPVFLHPDTHEEYALARTERKSGHGYKGFQFHTSPDVSLEEDLQRRDLTINAIARDSAGNIVDPYGGVNDIHNKVLRHVSAHFAEDPVRILRVARFAARYAHLGFTIAPETLELMFSMVTNGEVTHLVSERVWKETERSLSERAPHIFFSTLRQCGALQFLFPELDRLFGIPQPKQHHPEIDCGVHSLMSLEQASILSQSPTVRFASLMHDLGKGITPEEFWPSHKGHEKMGVNEVKQLCKRIKAPNNFRELTELVSEFHTHCHRATELKPKTLLKTLEKLDAFRRPERFREFLLSCEADSRGRTGFENRDYPQAKYFSDVLDACLKISPKEIDASIYKGKAFGDELSRRRTSALIDFKASRLTAQ
ncbi:multifunctional CCA addition/repair protein [Aurantivibrio plasticivorans]